MKLFSGTNSNSRFSGLSETFGDNSFTLVKFVLILPIVRIF